ncbi:MAG: serine/threonine protein kinase [Pseudonocardiales bacterium]|nr:MAG: serine/threonine protein kinase [Pseudonocardiales bacterium]
MSGWKLPGYVVEDLLGFGSSGDVWRARVASSGEPVALKRIAVGDAARRRAGHTEAALLATLDHPHLVRLHEVLPSGDAVVLVLDFAAGGTLAALVEARGRITPGEAITALAPVGAALAYAHNAGVVHGDVTPANVLFTEAGMPVLADLGVARLLGEDAPVRSTPAFVDPAVAAGCVPGPQSDVFMLGAVTLYALTGRPIWPGANPAEVLAAAALGETGDIDAWLTEVDVPQAVRTVVLRALAVEPSQRGSAAEFALDLRHAGTPLVVELSAGRPRATASLPSAADPAAAQQADTGLGAATGSDAVAAGSRPPFDRPRGAGPTTQAPVLTHTVRPRPRPAPSTRAHRAPPGGAMARWVGAVLAALALAAALAWTAFGDRGTSTAASGGSSPAPQVSSPARSTRAVPASGPAPGAGQASRSGPQPVRLDAQGAAAVLTRLDKLRQQAFADRDASLLGNVYIPGPLLTQDTALLERIVPAGCRLVGVHTSYDQVRVTARSGPRVQVAVRATLSQSLLVCAGSARGRASGSGPSTLHIVLAAHGAGYLIAGISR